MNTLGDLAQSFSLLRFNSELRQQMASGLKELGTEEVANLATHLRGDFSGISQVERSITTNESYARVLAFSDGFVTSQYNALEGVRAVLSEAGASILSLKDSTDNLSESLLLTDGISEFQTVLSFLNGNFSGKYLFSGEATQSAPFESVENILISFDTAISSATSAADVLSIADTWFSVGGDYDSVVYNGSTENVPDFIVSSSERISVETSGHADVLRDVLKVMSIYAVVSEDSGFLIEGEMDSLLSQLGQELISVSDRVLERSADIGAAQSRISRISAENQAELYSLASYRKDMVGVDIEQTIVKLTEVERNIEILYNVTARMSNLSLSDYL